MARSSSSVEREAPETPAPVKVRKFGAPDELSADFGVNAQSDERIQGIVASKNVRELLDAFGLQDRTELVFPFQHIKRQHGEIWRMRIEPAKHHSVDGKPVHGHQWMYEQQSPERVQGVQ